MIHTRTTNCFTIETDGDYAINGDYEYLASLVIEESDRNAKKVKLAEEDLLEFKIACDSLNLWRLRLRCIEETGSPVFGLMQSVADYICTARGYDAEDFDMAIEATRGRARVPFGINPLETAHTRALQEPIRLMAAEVSGPLTTLIANIARQLQLQVGDNNILLPIEQLRILLRRQKLVVSGAVRRLLDHGILIEVGESGIRRAREMRFVAEEGKHFEIARKERAREEGVMTPAASN
jgi:hypothetical protein